MNRFTAVGQHFRASRRFKGTPAQVARGLVFVQIYATYEYTVNTTLQVGIDAMMAHKKPFQDLRPSVLALFLESRFQSLKDSPAKNEWDCRLALLEQACSKDPALVGNGTMPVNGTHYRYEQLQLIFRVLGIRRRPAKKWQHLHRINEIVDHRNAIAHGRDTAENVGRQYTRRDIDHRLRQSKSLCLYLISTVEEYCTDPAKFCKRPAMLGLP